MNDCYRMVIDDRIHELLVFVKMCRRHGWRNPAYWDGYIELRALVRQARKARALAAKTDHPVGSTWNQYRDFHDWQAAG